MKIIHRYVLREFLETFFFGLLVFSIILLLDQIFQLINLFVSKGVDLLIVIKLFLLVLPNIFSLAIPMAVLFGILLTYSRLGEDNEITALRATGTHHRSYTNSILVFTGFLCCFLVIFNAYLSPLTHREFRKLYQEVLTQRPLIKFEEKTITNIGEYRFYSQKVEKETGILKGLNIYKFDPKEAGVPWRISASSATVMVSSNVVVFQLYNGYWQKANPSRKEVLIHMTFTKYLFTVPIGGPAMPTSQSLREMTMNELRKEILTYESKKMPTNFLENEYWLRFVLALAPLAFALIAIPLVLSTAKGSKPLGFGLSLLIIFVYYMLLVTALNLGEKGNIPSKFILWLPNAAAVFAGYFFWKKLAKK